MDSAPPSISNASSLLTKHFEIFSSAPITVGFNVTVILHDLFNFLAKSKWLLPFSFSFTLTMLSAETTKSDYLISSLFFLLKILRSSHPADIRWSICISKSKRIFSLICQQGFWVVQILVGIMIKLWSCPWCNRYRRRKWKRRHEFKS